MAENTLDISRYWKPIMDTVKDGLIIIDKMGRIIAANPAAEKLTGLELHGL